MKGRFNEQSQMGMSRTAGVLKKAVKTMARVEIGSPLPRRFSGLKRGVNERKRSFLVHWLFISTLVVTAIYETGLADGCFVFKWNKEIDINEPTQKAIIVHDAGREEMLLQVKYEGPLEEFGWLIPTPSLPKVEKGSMEPFYELSQLTQRRFGMSQHNGVQSLGEAKGAREDVKVIEIKTVGAYEVAILSAQDSGSLTRWLADHDYSLPEGKSEIIDEYIHRGWYFIAAKIELNKGIDLKMASNSEAKNREIRTSPQRTIQAKLSTGELHPLLISFDTAKPVFPLKISAVGGKTSEVSLYVIAKQPLLEKSLFAKAAINIQRDYTDWEQKSAERRKHEAMNVLRVLSMGDLLDSFYVTNHSPYRANRLRRPSDAPRDYSQEDLERIANEGLLPAQSYGFDETFYSSPEEMLQCMPLKSEDIPKCSRTFLRIKEGDWFLTKLVQIFGPVEMKDLEFEPAISELSGMLSQKMGKSAAQILARLGAKGEAVLRQACNDPNSTVRLNAVIGLERERRKGFGEVLSKLLKDDAPAVRLHAVYAAEAEPGEGFTDAMRSLLRDPQRDVRAAAVGYLSSHEPTNSAPVYFESLNDSHANVRAAALVILTRINRYPAPHEIFLEACRLLNDPDETVQEAALHTILGMSYEPAPREMIAPFLSNPHLSISGTALSILRRGTQYRAFEENGGLSAAEAAYLLTNSLTRVRLTGLKFLQHNGDAEAVELILPLLTETNTIVRNRAFVVLRRITRENTADDAEKWKDWWKASKASFSAGKTAP